MIGLVQCGDYELVYAVATDLNNRRYIPVTMRVGKRKLYRWEDCAEPTPFLAAMACIDLVDDLLLGKITNPHQ
jgi:hypothetical protein